MHIKQSYTNSFFVIHLEVEIDICFGKYEFKYNYLLKVEFLFGGINNTINMDEIEIEGILEFFYIQLKLFGV